MLSIEKYVIYITSKDWKGKKLLLQTTSSLLLFKVCESLWQILEAIEMNGGDDGARTRNFRRDRAVL